MPNGTTRNIVPSKWKEVILPVPLSCEVYPSDLKIKQRRGALSISFPERASLTRFSTLLQNAFLYYRLLLSDICVYILTSTAMTFPRF